MTASRAKASSGIVYSKATSNDLRKAVKLADVSFAASSRWFLQLTVSFPCLQDPIDFVLPARDHLTTKEFNEFADVIWTAFGRGRLGASRMIEVFRRPKTFASIATILFPYPGAAVFVRKLQLARLDTAISELMKQYLEAVGLATKPDDP